MNNILEKPRLSIGQYVTTARRLVSVFIVVLALSGSVNALALGRSALSPIGDAVRVLLLGSTPVQQPSPAPVRAKASGSAVAPLRARSVAYSHLVQPPRRLTSSQRIGRAQAAARGWTGREWTCLYTLWRRESQWNNRAQNPTSTAYGIPQFLDKTWATVGSTKTSSPRVQVRAGLTYISQRYGTPCRAWVFWWGQKVRSGAHWY